MGNATLRKPAGRLAIGVYLALVAAATARIAHLDGWEWPAWAVLFAFAATFAPDRVESPEVRSLVIGVAIWGGLTFIVAYLPDLWFRIANGLNHAENYLFRPNQWMGRLPFNDGRFLWSHQYGPLTRLMRWIYITGFDMVLWIAIVRSLVAFDAFKVARYSIAAHLIQFPLIMPFYTAIRVDEVWSVLGDPDRCERGWTNEMRLNLGANCFPSMHTSVAFAIMLLALREKSRPFRWAMCIYASAIIVSTVYMEIHWLVDIAGGLLLGYAAVKITDRVLSRSFGRLNLSDGETGEGEREGDGKEARAELA
jgi:membrane-associated phospholipid phosphatase